MEIEKLNPSQICRIKIFIKQECNHYEYSEEKSILSFVYKRAGFYFTYTLGSPLFMTAEEIEKDGTYICVDKKVYYKPHISISMSDGNVYHKFFENVVDLMNFMNSELISSINFIEK